ncbi:hypothetical protein EV207_1332 [Scopulibacillus darangshiensis]|uniref:Sporulation lipoprotein YhcN/YlaJ n=1 Tax=Scopulibacillus darangshiensis TaxID=442528 RepID=A0A4V2SLD7_9BACL|nr:hypothetical protein [Scopulibacillus darangshiensis]TCP22996.1 hypothetical protein EV207_1332 [Scopulibacillus darangshiensis]
MAYTKLIISGVMLLMTAAGCSAGPPEKHQSASPYQTGVETRTVRDRYFGMGPVTNYTQISSNRESGASYLGNQTGEFHNTNLKHHNLGHDQDMMRYTVNNTAGFKARSISIIGNNAFVNATYTGNDKAYKQAVNNLKNKLQAQMVRYDINLDVKNK